jgi:hypothetical protein
LSGKRLTPARNRALPAHEVVVRLGLDVEDVALEVEPERGVGDRQLAYLLSLGEDRDALAGMVDVLELDRLEGALSEAVIEQQAEGDPVPEIGLGRDDGPPLIRREGRAVHRAAGSTLRDFAGVWLSDVDRPSARAWALRQPRGNVYVVRAMFGDAVRDGLAPSNPFRTFGSSSRGGTRTSFHLQKPSYMTWPTARSGSTARRGRHSAR